MRCRSEYSAALDGREAAVLLQRRGWLRVARSATVAGPKMPEAQVSAVAVKTRLLRILEGAPAALAPALDQTAERASRRRKPAPLAFT